MDPRKAGVYKLRSGEPADVLRMRIVCHIHEAMLDSFLQAWHKNRGRGRLLALGPWSAQEVGWEGAGSSSPLKEVFHRPEKASELDPVRRNAANMARYHDKHDEGRKDANALKLKESGSSILPQVALSTPKDDPRHKEEQTARNAWRSRLIREPKQKAIKDKKSAAEVRAIELEGHRQFSERPWLNRSGPFKKPDAIRAGAGRKPYKRKADEASSSGNAKKTKQS